MIKKYEKFIGDKKNPIYKESETGKEHSLNMMKLILNLLNI